MSAQQCKATFTFFVSVVSCCNQFFGIHQSRIDISLLGFNQFFDAGFKRFELLDIAFGCRSRNNQRRSCIVNQNAIRLIDHRIVMLSLNLLLRRMCHIVAQIIKTKFIVRSVGDVGQISQSTLIAVGSVVLKAIHAKSQEVEQGGIPFAITTCQVIVYGNHVNTTFSKGVEVGRKRTYQRFSFSRCHLRDFSAMQCNTTNQLNIVVDHIPTDFSSSGRPFVFIAYLIVLNGDVRMF